MVPVQSSSLVALCSAMFISSAPCCGENHTALHTLQHFCQMSLELTNKKIKINKERNEAEITVIHDSKSGIIGNVSVKTATCRIKKSQEH